MSYRPNLLNEVSFDAGGRFRMGQLTTLGDLKTLDTDDLLLWENTGTGAASGWADNKYTLSVALGEYQIRRSKHYFPYFSGKSQQVEITFDGFQSQSGVTKRIGYFSSSPLIANEYDADKDGFWIEDDGTTKYLKVSRKGTETLSVPMASWNGDKDILSYDWSNFTVVLFDFLWLGGAVLRVFVKLGDKFALVHQFDYAGTASNTFTYSPNQCVRAEARGVSDGGSFRLICAQVSTEGSITESGKQRSVYHSTTGITLSSSGVMYPMLGIRKKTTHRDRTVKQVGVSAFVQTNTDQLLVTVQLNPSLTLGGGSVSWTDESNSAVQRGAPSGGVIVGAYGSVLFSLMIAQNSTIPPNILELDFLSSLGHEIDNTSDELWVCGMPVSGPITCNASIGFKEY